MLRASMKDANPKFAQTLSGTIADERRHVGFGENRIGALIREYPEKKAEVEKLQKEMTYYMLATFADRFRDGGVQEERRRIKEKMGDVDAAAPAPSSGGATRAGGHVVDAVDAASVTQAA